jgi:hypothetical protein
MKAIGPGGGERWDKEEGEGEGRRETHPPIFSNTPSLNYLEISLGFATEHPDALASVTVQKLPICVTILKLANLNTAIC